MKSFLAKLMQEMRLEHTTVHAAERILPQSWEPRAFTKLCEEALRTENLELQHLCGRLQAYELLLLFDYVIQTSTEQSVQPKIANQSGEGSS
mmetsp:Transcript_35524/g.65067  ORF Transcript_35524/g.65067 Transcript_35524/m.65067 type:complete len:92 (+) Transcript_35524:119-394(+)